MVEKNGPNWPNLSGFGNEAALPRNIGPVLKWAIGLVSVLVSILLLAWLGRVYTDFLWFGNLGYTSIFRTILLTKVWLYAAGAGLFAAVALINIYISYRYGDGPQLMPVSDGTLSTMRRVIFIGAIAVVVVAALVFGGVAARRWELVQAFLNASPFGILDPQFGRDISFFVFHLPLQHFIQGWLLGVAIVCTLLTAAMYFVLSMIRGATFNLNSGMRIHLSVLGAAILLLFGYGYWLGIYDLVFSDRGAVFGATYTDVHARIPAMRVLFSLVIAAAVLLMINAFVVKGVRLVIGIVILWISAAVLVGLFFPSLMQRFQVIPQELNKERPYIERNIKATRDAFGIGGIVEQPYPIHGGGLTRELIEGNQETIDNVRLWDHRPLRDTLNQIQFFRVYYEFQDVDVDRYTVDGEYRQVMASARELSPENLPEEAQTWVNRHLQFTHGNGATMSPVTEFTSEGRPEFLLKDVPTVGQPELTKGQVYYGENTTDYVIVNSNMKEFDYPTDSGSPVYTNYTGDGGVQLSSFLRRFAYAWQLREVNLLISGEISPESRLQYRRTVEERVSTVAPFLKLDSDPYIVVDGGQLFFIQDAYTVADRYPYSSPDAEDGFNYIRNSVKVVMNAYDGSLNFYNIDAGDPLLTTYAKIFPDLFQPISEMPVGLRDHLRYPEDLFRIQANKYLQYHMQDSTVFYNKEDQWSIPNEQFFGSVQPMEPYYLIMRLPDEDHDEFVLLMPFTPANRPNLVAWLAARNDGEHYGQLVSFLFPRGQQLDGPQQVEARIDNDPDISAQITLWDQSGSRVLRGNLLAIPMDNTILYVEPLYLQAANLTFPELKRVILADANKVVMSPSLEESLAMLIGESERLDTSVSKDTADSVAPQVGTEDISILQQLQQELLGLKEVAEGLKIGALQIEESLRRLQQIAGGDAQ